MSKQNEKREKPEKQKKKPLKFLKKDWWRNRKVIRGGIVLILSILFFFISFFWVPGEVYCRVRETYTFTADEAATLNLAVLLPSSGPYQDVFDPVVEWPGTWQINPDGRLQVLTMETTVQAGETIKAVITYRVNLSQGTALWVDEPVIAADVDPSADIQSDAPEIIAQAELLQVEGDEESTLRRIFEFTKDYLDVSQALSGNGDESALSVFRNASGGMEGRANLVAALSRASGLPAKTISGIRFPNTFPLIPAAANGAYPGQNSTWNEVFYDSAWGQVDPNAAGEFFRPAAFGWTDGRYLMFASPDRIAKIIQGFVQNAETNDQWVVSSTESLRYAAWADVDQGRIEVIPKVSLMTTWDARWVMLIALITICVMIVWLMEGDQKRKRLLTKRKN